MVARQTGWDKVGSDTSSFIKEDVSDPTLSSIRKVERRFVHLTFAPAKTFECYMVKPHGQLVLVSFIHY